MKKLFLSLIAAVAGTMSSFAQDDLIATLSHGSSLSTFTGATALSEAYEAAVEGDVITLSPGVFNAVNIEKAITVRGAGMVAMESNGYVSTQLSGDITINVPSDALSTLTIEGIHALGTVNIKGNNLAPINLLRSRFENNVEGVGVNMNAFSCIFADRITAKYVVSSDYRNTTLNCTNCVLISALANGYSSNNVVAKIVATNCILLLTTSVSSSVFTNCVIISYNGNNHNWPLANTCSAQNCLGINSDNKTPNLFENIINTSNVMAEGSGTSAYTAIFKTLTSLGNNPAITETFELTETAAATYLGDDGTQVGIYGGSYPFDPTPSNPQIKKFTVSNSTDGGTLKVKINVE